MKRFDGGVIRLIAGSAMLVVFVIAAAFRFFQPQHFVSNLCDGIFVNAAAGLYLVWSWPRRGGDCSPESHAEQAARNCTCHSDNQSALQRMSLGSQIATIAFLLVVDALFVMHCFSMAGFGPAHAVLVVGIVIEAFTIINLLKCQTHEADSASKTVTVVDDAKWLAVTATSSCVGLFVLAYYCLRPNAGGAVVLFGIMAAVMLLPFVNAACHQFKR